MPPSWNEAAPLLEALMLALMPSRDTMTWRLMQIPAHRGVPLLEAWRGPFVAVPHVLVAMALMAQDGIEAP